MLCFFLMPSAPVPAGIGLQGEQGCLDPWALSSAELQEITDSEVGFGFCSVVWGCFYLFYLSKGAKFLKENKLFKKMAIL